MQVAISSLVGQHVIHLLRSDLGLRGRGVVLLALYFSQLAVCPPGSGYLEVQEQHCKGDIWRWHTHGAASQFASQLWQGACNSLGGASLSDNHVKGSGAASASLGMVVVNQVLVVGVPVNHQPQRQAAGCVTKQAPRVYVWLAACKQRTSARSPGEHW